MFKSVLFSDNEDDDVNAANGNDVVERIIKASEKDQQCKHFLRNLMFSLDCSDDED